MSHWHSLPVVLVPVSLWCYKTGVTFVIQDISQATTFHIIIGGTISLRELCQALMAFMYPSKNVNTQSFGNDALASTQLGYFTKTAGPAPQKSSSEPGHCLCALAANVLAMHL